MFQKIGKMLPTFIIFFTLISKLYADPCADWDLLLPPARYGAAMAFDSLNNKTILFGGQGIVNGNVLDDTWSWDGTSWTQLFPSTSPSARTGAAIAYDSKNKNIVLFGGTSNSGNLGDTWIWDGTNSNWTKQDTSLGSPSVRTNASMAFDDSTNNKIILFGGSGLYGDMNDTWSWDGSVWSQLLDGTSNSPPATSGASMAFDTTSSQLILFLGTPFASVKETWSFDPGPGPGLPKWTQLTPTTSPDGRLYASMAYNPNSDELILFGGTNISGYLNDTWIWDSTHTTWKNLTPTTSPSPRFAASFALDSNNKLILFGGKGDPNILGDTWSWNGTGTGWSILSNPPSLLSFASMAFDSATNQLILFGGGNNATFYWNGLNWIQLLDGTTSSPPARSFASMAFDSATHQLILFGGFNGTTVTNDTWKWNGTKWKQLFPSTSPSARSDYSMAFDSATNQLILFGGFDGTNVFNDTWNWDGKTWNQLLPSTSPSARLDASLAFDPVTNRLILFGGLDSVGDALDDTWSWDGTNWTQLFPATSPPARSAAPMAFDPGTNQVILVGGFDFNFNNLRDTWSWDGTTWTELHPSSFPIATAGASMAFDSATDQMVYCDTVSNTWNWDSFPPFFAIAKPSSETIRSGDKTHIALSSNVKGATFSWTVATSGVSGASYGSGKLIAQTLTTCVPGTVTYTITPTSSLGCQGSPITVVVTVEPFSRIRPPTHVKGFQRFFFPKSCEINIITWQPPKKGPSPASYRIYCDAKLTKLAAEIPANHKLKFEDSCSNSIYYIVSVDFCGFQSEPVVVSIKRDHHNWRIPRMKRGF